MTAPANNKGSQFWPLYSSHGHGRKTHLASSHGGGTLCGTEQRHPWLILTFGSTADEGIDNIKSVPDPDGVLCKTCRRLAFTITDQQGDDHG